MTASPALLSPPAPHLTAHGALKDLGSDAELDLSQAEVSMRRQRHGPNALPERPGKPAWLRSLGQFNQALIYVLLAAGFITAVAMAVGAIPEGLPAVETLGGVTVIRTDKTGTLTQNQMTVERLWAGGHGFEVSGVGYAPEGKILRQGHAVAVTGALREALLNCRSMTQPLWRLPLFGNPWVWLGVAAMALLQVGFTYLPGMQQLFRSTALAWQDWGLILMAGGAVAFLVSLEKWLLDRFPPSHHHPSHQ